MHSQVTPEERWDNRNVSFLPPVPEVGCASRLCHGPVWTRILSFVSAFTFLVCDQFRNRRFMLHPPRFPDIVFPRTLALITMTIRGSTDTTVTGPGLHEEPEAFIRSE